MENEKVSVFVPEENITVSFEVTNDTPFNKCFKCRSFRNGCSGPNLFAMGITRACEFLQLARIFLGYSYQYVADNTGVSLATVKRILTGKITDPNYFTVKALSDLLLGDPTGKSPCATPDIIDDFEKTNKLNDAMRELERALADNKDYREALDSIHASYNSEMQLIRADAQKQVEGLLNELHLAREECERWRVESEHWRYENDRKGKLIDTYMEKIISK